MEFTRLSVDRYLRYVLVTLHITGLIILIAQSTMRDLFQKSPVVPHFQSAMVCAYKREQWESQHVFTP